MSVLHIGFGEVLNDYLCAAMPMETQCVVGTSKKRVGKNVPHLIKQRPIDDCKYQQFHTFDYDQHLTLSSHNNM